MTLSTEVNTVAFGNPVFTLTTPPSAGVLVTAWVELTTGYSDGNNANIFSLNYNTGNAATSSAIWCAAAHVTTNGSSSIYGAGTNFYLGNPYSLPQWAGGFAGYTVSSLTVATITGWVFVAFYLQIDTGASLISTYSWLQFGTAGTLTASPNNGTTTVAQMRLDAISQGISSTIANAWTPSGTPTSLDVGFGGGLPVCMWEPRVYSLASVPSLATIQAVARLATADSTAWGDWSFNDPVSTTDASGHGHNLTVGDASAHTTGLTIPSLSGATDTIYAGFFAGD